MSEAVPTVTLSWCDELRVTGGKFGIKRRICLIISPANLATLVGHLRGYQKYFCNIFQRTFVPLQERQACLDASSFSNHQQLVPHRVFGPFAIFALSGRQWAVSEASQLHCASTKLSPLILFSEFQRTDKCLSILERMAFPKFGSNHPCP